MWASSEKTPEIEALDLPDCIVMLLFHKLQDQLKPSILTLVVPLSTHQTVPLPHTPSVPVHVSVFSAISSSTVQHPRLLVKRLIVLEGFHLEITGLW